MSKIFVVKAAYDPEAAEWYIENSDVPGLAGGAATLERLLEKLPGMILDLIEENGLDGDGHRLEGEVPIELIAHASTRVRATPLA